MFTILAYVQGVKKNHENLKKIIFQSRVSDLDQIKYSKFFYYYTGLGAGCSTEEAITASFVEHFKENQDIKENRENTTCVYFAVVINGNKNITW